MLNSLIDEFLRIFLSEILSLCVAFFLVALKTCYNFVKWKFLKTGYNHKSQFYFPNNIV